jgi:hypothetical protein
VPQISVEGGDTLITLGLSAIVLEGVAEADLSPDALVMETVPEAGRKSRRATKAGASELTDRDLTGLVASDEPEEE